MSLILIGAGAAAVALASGYLAARRARNVAERTPPKEDVPPALPAPAAEPTEFGTSLRLSDVVALVGVADVGAHRERWLSGGLVLREGTEVCAVVFTAHEGVTQRFVVSYPPPVDELLWSHSHDEVGPPIELGSEPPTTIEHRGAVFSRKRRLHVSITRVGRDAPRVGESGLFVEYRSSGKDALSLIVSGGTVVAAHGPILSRAEYDPMGSGTER